MSSKLAIEASGIVLSYAKSFDEAVRAAQSHSRQVGQDIRIMLLLSEDRREEIALVGPLGVRRGGAL